MIKYITSVILLMTLLAVSAYSQSSTNSPYSYFGLGELEPSDYGRTTGMGGVGIGISSSQFLNKINPASLSSIDTLSFLFDVCFTGKVSEYKNSQSSFSALNSGLKKLSIGFRINRVWATSLGIASYSNVGYNVSQTGLIEGTYESYMVNYQGDGGLSQFYWANSVKIGKNLSVGVDASYIFGSITKSEKYQSSSFPGYYSLNRKYTPNHLYFDFGAQYRGKLNDGSAYILGIVGGLKTDLKTSEYVTAETSTSSPISDIPNSVFNQTIPAFWGVGFSVKKTSWTFAADYKEQYWGNLISENNQHIFSNSRNAAVGVEYIPNVSVPRYFYQRMVYQAGFHYGQSYLRINDVNLDNYAITVGVGVPGRRERSYMGMSFEMGKRGTLTNGSIRENYYQITISLNLNDIWFVRPKYQ